MAVVAIAGALFAGAELAAGGLTLFQTIAAVGAVTAGVGAVTGDEDLMKIGGIATMAGGVGAFAQNQGWLSATQAAAEATSNTAAMTQTAAPGVANVAPVVDSGMPDMADSAVRQAGAEIPSATQQAITTTAPEIAAPTGVTQSPTMNTQPGGLVNTNPTDMRLAAQAADKGDIFSTLQKFADVFKDKDGKYDKNMLALGANFVGGMFDDKKKAEAALYRERAASEAAQRSNANAIPNLSGLKVTQKPGFKAGTQPVRVGLLNTVRTA